jgi:hypothetical protein
MRAAGVDGQTVGQSGRGLGFGHGQFSERWMRTERDFPGFVHAWPGFFTTF